MPTLRSAAYLRSENAKPVQWRRRLQISVALGLLAGLRAGIAGLLLPVPRDFAQLWYAAHAFLERRDPYSFIGPGMAFEWKWPLYYPLTAAVAAIPFTPLPLLWAGALFMAIAGGCFAWALMEHGYAPLLGFMSAAMVLAAETVQWSPLLAASLVLPPLALVAIAKPTIGAAMFVARPSWWPIAGGILLCMIAFMGQPDWLNAWRGALARGALAQPGGLHFTSPLSQTGGFLALLSALRWRRPEARLVAVLACVPQSLIIYEAVPLFLVPRTLGECALLLILSYVAQTIIVGISTGPFDMTGGRWIVWLLYIPATVMVLRRANVGPAPSWLEKRIARWPVWLRGSMAAA